tara:strand:+ start:66 stop:218 length:153 start_codon:yes stop_codon:yes gene_type:complete
LIVFSSPSFNENLGFQPSNSFANELSKALETAPVGFDVSNDIFFGVHPKP